MDFKIANNFTLPREIVTMTQAILARKRSGKSYTASVEAEEMLDHGQQIAVIDPTSAWWGLRSSADGKSPGYPIVVFGGDHADAPLDHRSGREMAAAMVKHGFSAIFDVGTWETKEQIGFVHQFASEILRINRDAIHLFIDEADTFAPQSIDLKEQHPCLGAMSRLVKQGGIKGVGVTMITQRSADINKRLLSQIDLLTVLRMSAPDDLVAPVKWIAANVGPEYAKEVEKALPRLGIGKGFICSNITGQGHYVEVRERRTFNSGATPKPGEHRAEPKILAPIDIRNLGDEIAAAIAENEANSPDSLRARIAELEHRLTNARDKEREGMLADQIANLEQTVEAYRAKLLAVADAASLAHQLAAALDRVAHDVPTDASPAAEVHDHAIAVYSKLGEGVQDPEDGDGDQGIQRRRIPEVRTEPVKTSAAVGGIGPAQIKLLSRLAELLAATTSTHVPKEQLAAWSEYSPTSGGFKNYLGQLRSAGLIDYPMPGTVSLTNEGRRSARPEPIPTTNASMLSRAGKVLGGSEARLLRLIAVEWPRDMSKDALAEKAGMAPTSGGFKNYLGHMRTLGFIDYPRPGKVRASDWLFIERKRVNGK